ncbi:MAG: hypothetical protein ACYCOU_03165 [Sulfobacillus sp.]
MTDAENAVKQETKHDCGICNCVVKWFGILIWISFFLSISAIGITSGMFYWSIPTGTASNATLAALILQACNLLTSISGEMWLVMWRHGELDIRTRNWVVITTSGCMLVVGNLIYLVCARAGIPEIGAEASIAFFGSSCVLILLLMAARCVRHCCCCRCEFQT